ncbi:GAF domain-containing protein [Pseudonocardia phyllosphaerae]|uniref:GAF domain-containing protein n=1 Tax=Pseudonocardia phyllosphaerae TaxID=3390502 RepID=UPI003978B805
MATQRRELERMRDAVLAGGVTGPDGLAPGLRPQVRESWARSLAAAVDPQRSRPRHAYEHSEVVALRSGHPLAEALPVLRDVLLSVADQARHMMIVTDERGTILWREGAHDVLRRADRVDLVEGTSWSEDCIGTNAMGTALSDDRPVSIHSAEHLVAAYHPWTCAAAPVHDPETGRLIGTVDVTGPEQTFHPTTLSLVTAAARLAEHRLGELTAARDERLCETNLPHLAGLGTTPGALLSPRGRVLVSNPPGRFPARVELPERGDRVLLSIGGSGGDPVECRVEPLGEGWLLRVPAPAGPVPPTLTLPFLGARSPSARRDGRALRLGLRHAEVLTLLALHPEGLTSDQLAAALYGDDGRAVTVRAEMHRLRRHVGEDSVRTQPYRLAARVDADFLRLREALRDGRVRDVAAEAARGPLLPVSESPAIRAEREHLEVAARSAVLRANDPDALWSMVRSGEADDELRFRLRVLLPSSDPRRDELA